MRLPPLRSSLENRSEAGLANRQQERTTARQAAHNRERLECAEASTAAPSLASFAPEAQAVLYALYEALEAHGGVAMGCYISIHVSVVECH